MAVDKVTVTGIKEAMFVFRQLPEVTRKAYTEIAVEPTAREIVRNAQNRLVPGRGFQSGQLQRALGYRLSEKFGSAWIGIRRGFETFRPGRSGSARTIDGARAHRPTKIGHLVEFGHKGPRPAPAHPFIVPAVEAEQGPFLMRGRAAGRQLEADMGAIGARNL